jgi:hypothetical protein
MLDEGQEGEGEMEFCAESGNETARLAESRRCAGSETAVDFLCFFVVGRWQRLYVRVYVGL